MWVRKRSSKVDILDDRHNTANGSICVRFRIVNMLTEVSKCSLLTLLVLSTCCLLEGQQTNSKRSWKGYAILGDGHLTAVYSDDDRITAATHAKGIQHFYFQNYTADYISSTSFNFPSQPAAPASVGMQNFFTAQTQTRLSNGASQNVTCFVHPAGAAVLSLSTDGPSTQGRYQFQAVLRKDIKTDTQTTLTSLHTENNVAVAVWSNGTALAIAPKSPAETVTVENATVTVTGTLSEKARTAEVLLIPAPSQKEALAKVQFVRGEKDLGTAASKHWNDWMNAGRLPVFKGNTAEAAQYLEAYKRNLYCVKSANLNGQIPADITGQFVTNNMPQLYPRDAMMCARVLLLTGHAEEARQIIEFWANPKIPMKTPGEWYARYDAHAKAVDAGSGARFDEPEWDANGYYLYLLNAYYQGQHVWLATPELTYKLADFLVNHLSPNGLLWEGGIVEWTGYLPATNMICSAALKTATSIARMHGNEQKAKAYTTAAAKISMALPQLFDKSRQTYADLRFTAVKGEGGVSLTNQSGQPTYLWDTTANVGAIWGYPNHHELQQSNAFYRANTVKLGGGMQYFDSPDPGLANYGHGVFFFTTAAAAEYEAMYGNRATAKSYIDWMIRNSNSYGLMPEHISPDGSEVSPASPLSWCGAEFAAALLSLSQS